MDLLQVYVRMFEPARDAAGSKKKEGGGWVFYVCYSMLCTLLTAAALVHENKKLFSKGDQRRSPLFGIARGTAAFSFPLFLHVFIVAVFGFFGSAKGEAPAPASPSSFFLLPPPFFGTVYVTFVLISWMALPWTASSSNAAFDAAHTFLGADLVMKVAQLVVVMRDSNALLSAALTRRNQSLESISPESLDFECP